MPSSSLEKVGGVSGILSFLQTGAIIIGLVLGLASWKSANDSLKENLEELKLITANHENRLVVLEQENAVRAAVRETIRELTKKENK